MNRLRNVVRTVAVGASVAGLAIGCTFPGGLTFGASDPDAGRVTIPVVDADAPDATFVDPGADAAAADGAGDADAGSLLASDANPDAACDYDGTWGTLLTIDVSWAPQGLTGFILASGTGQIRQWVKSARVQKGTTLTDTSVVCEIELPDFMETTIAGGETYGVKFPDALFDNGFLPTFVINGVLGGASPLFPGASYSTTPTAVLLGVTMANPATDPWPATITTEDDMDQDGKPGVTVNAAQGAPYSDIPTEIPGPLQQPARASQLYLAIRQVTLVTGTVQDCNTMTGTAQISTISGKDAIDSHVLGCALVGGGDCTTSTSSSQSSQASFVDNSQPVFTPSGMTSFQSIKFAAGATCLDVRSALH